MAQDTTDFNYSTHHAKEGLGPIHGAKQSRGLLSHHALALPVSGPPFGLVHLSLWARDAATHGKRNAVNERAKEATALKESHKWLDGLWGAEAHLPAELSLVVIGDREADFFDYFAADRRPQTQLLVRARHPRKVLVSAPERPTSRKGEVSLPDVLTEAPLLGTRNVAVPPRPGQKAREATLEVRAVRVWLLAPRLYNSDHEFRTRAAQAVWVVEARELAGAKVWIAGGKTANG